MLTSSNIKIGDKLLVLDNAYDVMRYHCDGWNSNMLNTVGKYGNIISFTNSSVCLRFDQYTEYYYAYTCLSKRFAIDMYKPRKKISYDI